MLILEKFRHPANGRNKQFSRQKGTRFCKKLLFTTIGSSPPGNGKWRAVFRIPLPPLCR